MSRMLSQVSNIFECSDNSIELRGENSSPTGLTDRQELGCNLPGQVDNYDQHLANSTLSLL